MPSITVTGRDDKITSRHRTHAEEKVSKLDRYFNGVTSIDVILSHDAKDSEAELLIAIAGGNKIVCQAKHDDLYAAIDLVIDKAETQLTRHKEKTRDHKAMDLGAVATQAAAMSAPEEEEDEAYQDIVEKRSFP